MRKSTSNDDKRKNAPRRTVAVDLAVIEILARHFALWAAGAETADGDDIWNSSDEASPFRSNGYQLGMRDLLQQLCAGPSEDEAAAAISELERVMDEAQAAERAWRREQGLRPMPRLVPRMPRRKPAKRAPNATVIPLRRAVG